MDCCDKALKMNRRDPGTWITKGNCLYDLGRNQEAKGCYGEASGCYRDAKHCYEKALGIDPANATAQKNKALAEKKLRQLQGKDRL